MKDYASFTLAASLLILTVTSPNVCLAQGISEYGGVMGIPKPVPKPEAAAGALNTLYGLPSRAANSAAAAADAHSRTNAVTAGGKKQKPGAKPKGAVVKSGDIPSNTVAATRQALIEHSRQAKELLDKANDAKSKGKIDEAEQLYAKSLQIREAYWRDTDKEIPNIQYKLGELYAQKGDLKKAEGTLQGNLAALSRFYGPGSENRLQPLLLLSDVYDRDGDKGKSYENIRQAYLLSKRAKDAPVNTVDIMLKAGKMALDLKKYREAEELYDFALSDSERAKLNHDQLLVAIDDYALALKGLNRERDADFVLKQAKQIRESSGASTNAAAGADQGKPQAEPFVKP